MDTTTKPLHLGSKISRLRELRGFKQEALALELGVSQQTVSRMEASEKVDDDMLDKIAKVLGISAEAIKNFNEELLIYNIQNNYEGSSENYSGLHHCTFNPLDKVVELYERLVQAEKDKVEMLEKLLKEK